MSKVDPIVLTEDTITEKLKDLGGQVIKIAPSSKAYINPLEINPMEFNYDSIVAKCNFVVSMCELILGDNAVLSKKETAVIDTACKNIYHRFAQDPVPEKMPIWEDLYNGLCSMPGEMHSIGLDLSIALSRAVGNRF